MYQDPLIDAMAQIEFVVDSGQFKNLLDKSNIKHIALFPRDRVGRLPTEKMKSYVVGRYTRHTFELKEQFGERIILGSTKRFDQRDDLKINYVDRILNAIVKRDLKFVGELMFTHADKVDGEINPTFERYVNSAGPNVFRLLDGISKNPIPVMFHWEVYNWERDWPNIKKMIGSYPNINFIWPHCGFANSEQVDLVFSTFDNVYATLSKRELVRWKDLWISHTGDELGGWNIVNPEFLEKVDGAIIDNDGIIKPQWVRLLQKYPDRFMFATDVHKFSRWKNYNKIVKIWREILGQLEKSLADKIGSKNAERIYGIG